MFLFCCHIFFCRSFPVALFLSSPEDPHLAREPNSESMRNGKEKNPFKRTPAIEFVHRLVLIFGRNNPGRRRCRISHASCSAIVNWIIVAETTHIDLSSNNSLSATASTSNASSVQNETDRDNTIIHNNVTYVYSNSVQLSSMLLLTTGLTRTINGIDAKIKSIREIKLDLLLLSAPSSEIFWPGMTGNKANVVEGIAQSVSGNMEAIGKDFLWIVTRNI